MCYKKENLLLASSFLFIFLVYPSHFNAQTNDDLIRAGDKAFYSGEYESAEKFYTRLLKKEPENYHVLKALAETEVKLKKFRKAEQYIDQILAMPLAKARTVFLIVEGETEPLEAELIDDNVMAIDGSAKQEDLGRASKFVVPQEPKPVPHYRAYIKKIGKVKLLPKSITKIKYVGIPQATHDMAVNLKTTVQKAIIASGENHTTTREEWIILKGGCFAMGSNQGDPDEQPIHKICVSPFKLGKFEVTQHALQAIMGINPSQHVGANFPADSVIWDEADDYCRKIGGRLPTEAEWEFAARAGTQSEYYWGSQITGKEANFCDEVCELNIRTAGKNDGFKHTSPVGSFPPNAFGLYDMSGNVGEWVSDWMRENYYRISPKENPRGPNPDLDARVSQSITHKVYRGGSWNQKPSELRSANRRDSRWQLRAEGIGFRCAANL